MHPASVCLDSPLRITFAVFIVTLLSLNISGVQADGPRNTKIIDELIPLLGHQSYRTRQRARRELETAGPTAEVRAALKQGLTSKSVEIRETCRWLLQQFEHEAFSKELQLLTSLSVDASNIRLIGWKEFSQLAGDDDWSRKLYGRIVRQHYPLICQLLNPSLKQTRSLDRFLSQTDPYWLPSQDAVSWSLLLFCDSVNATNDRPGLSTRILASLSHSGLGPTRISGGDQLVVQRLVDGWLAANANTGAIRERLIAAMRYQCHDRASELSRLTMDDVSASASSTVAAMLCASVLEHDDLRPQLIRRLEDHRTSHVWQLIASRKTKVRTQVRDVALALLLQRQGYDPRQFGYLELQADPLMLYRDHSLGFSDDRSREKAHEHARAELGI